MVRPVFETADHGHENHYRSDDDHQPSRQQDEILETIRTMRLAEEQSYKTLDYLRQQQPIWNKNDDDHSNNTDYHSAVEHRSGIVSWCYRLVDYFDFERETVSVAVSILDRFLATPAAVVAQQQQQVTTPIHHHNNNNNNNNSKHYQLVALTSLYIAIKVHEPKSICPQTFCQLSQGVYDEDDICTMELDILKALQWRVHPPTALSFVRLGLELLPQLAGDAMAREMIFDLARTQTEIAVAEYDFLLFAPSLTAFCALANAIQVVVGVDDGDDDASTAGKMDLRPLEQALVLQPQQHQEIDDNRFHLVCQTNPILQSIQSWLYDAMTNNDGAAAAHQEGTLLERCTVAVKQSRVIMASTVSSSSSMMMTTTMRKSHNNNNGHNNNNNTVVGTTILRGGPAVVRKQHLITTSIRHQHRGSPSSVDYSSQRAEVYARNL